MKKVIIFIAVCAVLALFGEACGDNDTVTYYDDKNGNGREDWGEGVWYEDKDGIHFFD